jgi:hypothetical protein
MKLNGRDGRTAAELLLKPLNTEAEGPNAQISVSSARVQRILHVDAEVPVGALDLGMAEQDLNRPPVAGPLEDR